MTDPNPLVVDVDYVAGRLKLDTPVDEETNAVLQGAILDAQADVVSYLGRPIIPTTRTATGLWPIGTDWSKQIDDDVIAIISATPETYLDTGQPTGTYTVTYTAGLDARNDPELGTIRTWITLAAMNSPQALEVWRTQTQPRGAMTSVSTDGQSASFAAPSLGGGGVAGSGAPGALPTIDVLYPWKKLSVFQRKGFVPSLGPWWW